MFKFLLILFAITQAHAYHPGGFGYSRFGRQQLYKPTAHAPLSETLFTETHKEGFLQIAASLPGVSSNNIRLELAGGKLTVEATRSREFTQKIFELPANTRRQDVTTNFQQGKLTIRVAGAATKPAPVVVDQGSMTPRPAERTQASKVLQQAESEETKQVQKSRQQQARHGDEQKASNSGRKTRRHSHAEKPKAENIAAEQTTTTKSSQAKQPKSRSIKQQLRRKRREEERLKKLAEREAAEKALVIPPAEALEVVDYEDFEPAVFKDQSATTGFYTNRGEFQAY